MITGWLVRFLLTPVNQNATISFSGPQNIESANLLVYNTNGETVFADQENGNTAFNFQRAGLPSGIYLYEIKTIDNNGEANFISGKIYLL
ncbi:MAG: T9SS type A sorting domain-containing protein [Chitinophagales bacterium]